MIDFPDREAATTWLFALYGATMLGIQTVEQEINLLYLVANHDPRRRSNAAPQRQVFQGARKSWQAFQSGSAGMKLNDTKSGIKLHIDPTLYADLDAFVRGPRNQLAHRFLVERVPGVARSGRPVLARCALELLETLQSAKRLADLLRRRTDEILATWPASEEPADEIREYLEMIGRMAILKQFPAELLRDSRDSGTEGS